MPRLAVPVHNWYTDPEAAGGLITPVTTRLTNGADLTIPVGRRSVTITVMAVAGDSSPVVTTTTTGPTTRTAILPEGAQITVGCDYPGDSLPAMTVTTVPGDDVLVVELSAV